MGVIRLQQAVTEALDKVLNERREPRTRIYTEPTLSKTGKRDRGCMTKGMRETG